MSTPSASKKALRWALLLAGITVAGLLFGLAQLQLAFLRSRPGRAGTEPTAHPGALAVAIRQDGALATFDGHVWRCGA